MKLTRITLMILGLVGSLGIVPVTRAVEAAPDTPGQSDKTQQFHGSVNSVDTKTMTLVVDQEVLNITLDTQLTFKGKNIVLADIAVGDRVLGTAQRAVNGRTEALTVVLQPLEKKPSDHK